MRCAAALAALVLPAFVVDSASATPGLPITVNAVNGTYQTSQSLQTLAATPQFSTAVGAKYRVASSLTIHNDRAPAGSPAGARNEKVVVVANLACYDSAGQHLSGALVNFGENALAGQEDLTLYPRFVLTGTGVDTWCRLGVQVLVAPSAGQSSSRYDVDASSYVKVSDLHSSSFWTVQPTAELVDPGVTETIISTHPTISGPAVLSSDVAMTGCRGIGDVEFGCGSHVSSTMVDATLELIVRQRKKNVTTGSDWCTSHTIATKSRRFSSTTVHHGAIFTGGAYTPDPACGDSVAVILKVRNNLGAGENLSVHPRTNIAVMRNP